MASVYNKLRLLIYSEIQNMVDLVHSQRTAIVVLLVFSILAFGFEIVNFTQSIDEERAIFFADWNVPTVWIGQGRPGITLIKLLFNTEKVVPLWNTFLAVLLLLMSCVVWVTVFTKNLKTKVSRGQVITVFGALFLTMPIHAEYMAFSTYNFEISVGFLFSSLSTLFLTNWFQHRDKISLGIGLLTYVFVLSIYQSFITVLLCGLTLSLALYYSNRSGNTKSISWKELLRILGGLILIMLAGYLSYLAIDKILREIYPSSGYIEGFFWWSYLDVSTIFRELRIYFSDIVIGKKIFGGIFFLPTIVLGFCVMGIRFVRDLKSHGVLGASLVSMLTLGVIGSPFMLSLLTGSPTPLRAMQVLPLMMAGVWLLAYDTLGSSNFRFLLVCLVVLVGSYQSQSMTRLFYSDNLRYGEDIVLGHLIATRITNILPTDNPELPVVFVGKRAPVNSGIIRSEVLGKSFFEWEGGNTYRIAAFLNNLGYRYPLPSPDQIKEAQTLSSDMPPWPDPGSVEIIDNIIVIKLSDI